MAAPGGGMGGAVGLGGGGAPGAPGGGGNGAPARNQKNPHLYRMTQIPDNPYDARWKDVHDVKVGQWSCPVLGCVKNFPESLNRLAVCNRHCIGGVASRPKLSSNMVLPSMLVLWFQQETAFCGNTTPTET